jgi:hypothetical protein
LLYERIFQTHLVSGNCLQPAAGLQRDADLVQGEHIRLEFCELLDNEARDGLPNP